MTQMHVLLMMTMTFGTTLPNATNATNATLCVRIAELSRSIVSENRHVVTLIDYRSDCLMQKTCIFGKSASRKSSKLSMVLFRWMLFSDGRFFCWTRRFSFPESGSEGFYFSGLGGLEVGTERTIGGKSEENL